jgi:hypothetical protein
MFFISARHNSQTVEEADEAAPAMIHVGEDEVADLEHVHRRQHERQNLPGEFSGSRPIAAVPTFWRSDLSSCGADPAILDSGEKGMPNHASSARHTPSRNARRLCQIRPPTPAHIRR